MSVLGWLPADGVATGDEGRAATRTARIGTSMAVGVLGLATVVSFVSGTAAVWLAPALSLAAGLVLAMRCQVDRLVVLTLWLWMLAPLARRLIDWQSTYHDLSPVLLCAPLTSLMALVAVRRWRGVTVRRPIAVLFGAMVLGIGYGTVLGLARYGAPAVFAAAVELAAPLVLGYAVLMYPQNQRILQACFPVARWGVLVIGGYAIVQFALLPVWDEQWILDSGISTVGQPVATQVRIFSTMNTAGPFAHFLSGLLLLVLGDPRRRVAWTLPVLAVGYIALGLSLVRAAWVAHLVALLVLVLARRVRLVPLLVSAAAIVSLTLLIGGPVVDAIAGRVENTVADGSQDQSLQSRMSLQGALADQLVAAPWGEGLGATGLATQLGADAGPQLQNVDSGIFETMLTLGLLFGGLLLLATFLAAVSMAAGAVAGRVDPASAALFVALAAGLVFTDTYKSAFGGLLWLAAGLLGQVRVLPALRGRRSGGGRQAASTPGG
ncbi:MAG: hypothetical protein ACK5MT_04540 [Actinomycetales bacterium]